MDQTMENTKKMIKEDTVKKNVMRKKLTDIMQEIHSIINLMLKDTEDARGLYIKRMIPLIKEFLRLAYSAEEYGLKKSILYHDLEEYPGTDNAINELIKIEEEVIFINNRGILQDIIRKESVLNFIMDWAAPNEYVWKEIKLLSERNFAIEKACYYYGLYENKIASFSGKKIVLKTKPETIAIDLDILD